MESRCDHWEQRSAQRYATPGKVWCLGEHDENFAAGWTTDTSRSGMAFITRSSDAMRVGETVSICYTDPRVHLPECEELRVCRIEPYGPSLNLIACTRFS